MSGPILSFAAAALLAGGLAVRADGAAEAGLETARRQAAEAEQRSRRFERQAAEATDAAARARARSEALAARIEAAEADLTAAETRIALIDRVRAAHQARLAERQAPVVRLTAALQTMARRPPALALVQPGSMDDVVHVRALLSSTLPEIRRRTAALREELRRAEALQLQAAEARRALVDSRAALRSRRAELARFEAANRARSAELSGRALAESDRALAFGEEARALARLAATSAFQARLEAELAALPAPLPRPGDANAPAARRRGGAAYLLPVTGRVVTGVGEISDAGVHARGVTLVPEPGARVVAPADGRIIYAAPFRGYGNVVILDHGGGWTSVVTDLASLDVAVGRRVRRGEGIGRAAERDPQVTIELRRDGVAVPMTRIVAG